MKSKLFIQNDMNLHARALAFLAVLAMTSYSSSAQAPPPAGAAPQERIEGFKEHMIAGTKWYQHDPDRPQPPIVTPGAAFSQMAPPPSDAEVLFDGKDLSKWQSARGQEANWKVQDGYMEVVPPNGNDIRTKGKWSDFQLHVEFAEPNPPGNLHGQSRGNSGILINNMYEVQVLDSYNDKTYADGQAGGIYGQMPPLVNACRPPGEWQTYDIIWESPRWSEQHELTQKACITVLHNGVVIQHKTEFIGSTDGIGGGVAWRGVSKYTEHAPEVFVQLQNHNANPVRFRNIWIRDLHLASRQ
ncbi:MAG: DUF1080 domain-containing protein [Verrucomicrobiota bacterium]|jgi:hypothetical protein